MINLVQYINTAEMCLQRPLLSALQLYFISTTEALLFIILNFLRYYVNSIIKQSFEDIMRKLSLHPLENDLIVAT